MTSLDVLVEPRLLADGATLRPATREDVPALGELILDRMGPEDQLDLELIAASPGGLAGIVVVERDGKVVATATLLDEQVRVGQVVLPAGQIELVASARDAEHRGYVRAVMDWCHQLSAVRGHVVQVMIGIPNFYRQFGYEYAIPMHPLAPLTREVPSSADFDIRRATENDIAAMNAVQEATQASFDVAMPHQDDCWRWLLGGTNTTLWVAEREVAGALSIDGVVRVAGDDDWYALGELATRAAEATSTILRSFQQRAASGAEINVFARPHVPGLLDLLDAPERAEWYYVRIVDPSVLFEALRPELSARLAASEGIAESGEGLISSFRSHVRFQWDAAGVGPMQSGGPLQAPVSAGGSGIPLQALAALIFECGAAGIEQRFPDASLGKQADLMQSLFPSRSADLLTWYLST